MPLSVPTFNGECTGIVIWCSELLNVDHARMWLPGSRRNHAAAGLLPVLGRKDHAAISRHNDLIVYHVQPHEFGLGSFLEATVDRVADHLAQFLAV